MTEDYKKNLIDYVTNNLQETSPTTEETFKETININRSKWTSFMPSSWDNMRIEGFINPSENTSNLGVMYGGYRKNGVSYGIIILVDVNLNPIKYIDSFSSGTKLRYIQCLMQGDDNLFYAIDDTEMSYQNTNISNTQKRFILLNNFSTNLDNNYKVILRKSYILSGADYQNFYCSNIYKEPGASHFGFAGKYAYDSSSVATRIKAIELKINVGEPNVWNYWKVDSLIFPYANFISFDSQSRIKVQFIGCAVGIYKLYLEKKDYSSNSITESELFTFDYRISISNYVSQQGLFLDENNAYFVQDNQDLGVGQSIDRHIGIFHYNFNNSTLNQIYDHYLGNYQSTTTTYERIQINKHQGKLYFALYNNFADSKANYYIQRYDGTWNPILIGNYNFIRDQRGLYVGSKYNILQIALYPTNFRSASWFFYIIKEIYNQNQYNGEPYVNSNVLVPLYSNLYSGESLVFSRNLYNITKQNNQTMSSVEIPNTYLNDTEISQNDLISKTNVELNNDTTSWNKNIYEVVDLNFINTISVIDEDTNTPYLNSAIKLNNSTTDGGNANYTNTPCNKARLNYTDNTTKIISVNWSSIDDTHKETLITFYVDKAINSIDLISHDETTIYLNIPVEVEVGKYYSISQKIRIE